MAWSCVMTTVDWLCNHFAAAIRVDGLESPSLIQTGGCCKDDRTIRVKIGGRSLWNRLSKLGLPERIHCDSLDDQAIFISLHEGCKPFHISRVRRNRDALLPGKYPV